MKDLYSLAWRLPIALCACVAGASADLRSGAPERFELNLSDTPLAGRGPSMQFTYTASHDGLIFVHAISDRVDLFLRVEKEDAGEQALAEDDNSAGGTTPAVAVEVTAGLKLRLIVAAAKPGLAGACEIHVLEGIETPATRAAVLQLESALREIDGLGKKGDIDSARKRLLSALDSALATPGAADSPAIMNQLKPLAVLAYYAHDYALAEKALLPLLGLLNRAFPPGAPDVLAVKGNLAIMLKMQGKLREALPIEEDLHQRLASSLPEDHPQLQKVRVNLALTRKELGDLRGARDLEEKAIASLQRSGADRAQLIPATGNLASTYLQLGDLSSARALQEVVLKYWEDAGKADDDEGLRARSNLALTLRELGDLEQARAMEETVLAVRSRTLPEDDRERLGSMGNLAMTLAALGKTQEARKLEESVLEARQRLLPDDHEELQYARTNLGNRLFELGDLAGALKLQEKVLEIRSRTLPAYHSRLLAARGNVALTLSALGDLQGARRLFADVHATASQTLPDESPDLEQARSHYAWVLARMGEREALGKLITDLCHGVRRRLDILELSLSPREVEAVALGAEEAVSDVLSLVRGAGTLAPFQELEAEAFALVERLRGAAMTGSLLSRVSGAGVPLPPEISRIRAELKTASEEIARLAQEMDSDAGSREKLLSAVRRRDETFRDLRGRLGSLPGATSVLPAFEAAAISKALQPGTAAVAFRRYRWLEIDATTRKRKPPVARYLAFVLRPDAPLRRIELGDAEDIEKAIELWRQAEAVDSDDSRGIDLVIGKPRPRVESAGERLRQLVLDPLRPALGDARTVAVALDGALHLVPLDALPEGRGLVGDKLSLAHHSALKEITVPATALRGTPSLLLVGGVDYEPGARTEQATLLAIATRGAPVKVGGHDARARRFRPLPGTLREVDEVAKAFREAFAAGSSPVVLRGEGATREAFERDAPSFRFVHLSTHGYFAPETLRSIADGATASTIRSATAGFAPLALAGLAFAGANQPPGPAARVPGILTAEELAAIDLRGCELAVLSACDTGVGLARAGQCVASLELAVRAAGARSAIASLWKVPDEASRELMIGFYRRLWRERLPKAQALWEAKQELRSKRNTRGEPVYSLRDWAAWVLVGDAK